MPVCVEVCVGGGMCVDGSFGTCCDSKLLAEDPRDDWQHKTSLETFLETSLETSVDPSMPRGMHY